MSMLLTCNVFTPNQHAVMKRTLCAVCVQQLATQVKLVQSKSRLFVSCETSTALEITRLYQWPFRFAEARRETRSSGRIVRQERRHSLLRSAS